MLSPSRRRLRYLLRRLAIALAVAILAVLLGVADRAELFGRAVVGDYAKYHGKTFTVTRVVDGDTLDVACADHGKKTTRIRLLGVDTPETVRPDTPVQHFGPESTAFLRNLHGRRIQLRLDARRTRDHYRPPRLLAYIVVVEDHTFVLPDGADLALKAGENVNLAIVATGHGYADPRFANPLHREFARAQRAAIKARCGLWKDVTADDLPPYYRQGPHRLTLP